MKKNRTMRVSALLLALTLITSCFVGGTFARYTTTAGDTVTARVARWGFTANDNSIVLDDLFSSSYVKNGAIDDAVKASDGTTLLVAPGTMGRAHVKFEYDNASGANGNVPEVAYTFTVDTTGSQIDENLKAKLRWSLDNSGDISLTWDQLMDEIARLSGDASGSKDYAPNTLPDAFDSNNQHTIWWRWVFEEPDGDAADTALGNASTLEGVTIKITITATQID